MVFVVFAVVYFNDLALNNRMKKIKMKLGYKNKRSAYVKWELQNQLVLSVTFTFYVLALSSASVQFFTETNEELQLLFSLDPKKMLCAHYEFFICDNKVFQIFTLNNIISYKFFCKFFYFPWYIAPCTFCSSTKIRIDG